MKTVAASYNFGLHMMSFEELRDFLNEKADLYNNRAFVDHDPISIPHSFGRKEDQEVAGILMATISWGNRKSIIANGHKMMELLDNAPFEFVISHEPTDLKTLKKFVHRTFNGEDLAGYIRGLRGLYAHQGGLEKVFTDGFNETQSAFGAIDYFRGKFFSSKLPVRLGKHIASPATGSAAKRLNMYLRWMVRRDKCGVDFGIWKNVPMSCLSIPLDVHTANISRKLGMLARKQNDQKAVQELDALLRQMDAKDPVKYDYALFGLGAIEGF